MCVFMNENKSYKSLYWMKGLANSLCEQIIHTHRLGLTLNPLPNINLEYFLILKDEHQRKSYMNPLVPSDSSAFMTGTSDFMSKIRNHNKGRKQVQRPIIASQRSRN